MRTKGDLLNLFLRYLDEATKKGVDLPQSKNADYRDKFNYFLYEAMVYVSTFIKIPSVFQVTQYPIPNLLGQGQGFDAQILYPNTPYLLQFQGIQAYYFELNTISTALFEENVNGVWTALKTINNTVKNQYTPYKGNLTLTNLNNQVRVTFSSQYPCVVRNIGLFAYKFPSDADVPDYTPQVSYDVPADFMGFDAVIQKDAKLYSQYTTYKWEKNKKVIIDYEDQGSFDIHYNRYPVQILSTDDDTTQIDPDIEDKAIDLIVLQAGIKATAADNKALSSWLRSLYIEQVQNVTGAEMIGETTVQTVYSMM